MVHKILFWAGFGIATRFLQLGIEMRPFFQRGSLWVYTLFAGVGGSFGYWMKGVEDRQMKMLQERKEILIEKRKRRAEREVATVGAVGSGMPVDAHLASSVVASSSSTSSSASPEQAEAAGVLAAQS